MTRTFFRIMDAQIFARQLMDQGFENVTIWTDTDGFGQTVHIVKW